MPGEVVHDSKKQTGSQKLLIDPQFELMPFDSFENELQKVPHGAQIAITVSPQLGIEATIEKSEKAMAYGYDTIPHLGARYVRDMHHLDEIASRLTRAGVTDIFVPAGDLEEPVGSFASAYELLVALDQLGYTFREVGITGYPEGHPFLDDRTLADAMKKKAPYATYIVTQLCFAPQKIIEWVEEIRRQQDVNLAIDVGIPGVVRYQRLLQISRRVGVKESIKFLQKTTGIFDFMRHLFGSWGRYSPDALIDGLAPYAHDPEYHLRGVHIFTFNQVRDTEEWRLKRLQT